MTERDREYEEDHVEAGRDDARGLRWIEAGQLRLEEDGQGVVVTIANPRRQNACWLTPTELTGLTSHLAGWFNGGAADKIRQIVNCATYVQLELEAQRRAGTESNEALIRALDALGVTCRALHTDVLFAEGTR